MIIMEFENQGIEKKNLNGKENNKNQVGVAIILANIKFK